MTAVWIAIGYLVVALLTTRAHYAITARGKDPFGEKTKSAWVGLAWFPLACGLAFVYVVEVVLWVFNFVGKLLFKETERVKAGRLAREAEENEKARKEEYSKAIMMLAENDSDLLSEDDKEQVKHLALTREYNTHDPLERLKLDKILRNVGIKPRSDFDPMMTPYFPPQYGFRDVDCTDEECVDGPPKYECDCIEEVSKTVEKSFPVTDRRRNQTSGFFFTKSEVDDGWPLLLL